MIGNPWPLTSFGVESYDELAVAKGMGVIIMANYTLTPYKYKPYHTK